MGCEVKERRENVTDEYKRNRESMREKENVTERRKRDREMTFV